MRITDLGGTDLWYILEEKEWIEDSLFILYQCQGEHGSFKDKQSVLP